MKGSRVKLKRYSGTEITVRGGKKNVLIFSSKLNETGNLKKKMFLSSDGVVHLYCCWSIGHVYTIC